MAELLFARLFNDCTDTLIMAYSAKYAYLYGAFRDAAASAWASEGRQAHLPDGPANSDEALQEIAWILKREPT